MVKAMNKEYTGTQAEYTAVTDYIEVKERLDLDISECFRAIGEYSNRGKEFADSIEPEMMVRNPNRTNGKKKKQHRKTLQSMAYTVATVATVAVLIQTTEPARESIAGATIVFEGNGELTKEAVELKFENYEMDGNFNVVIEEGITGIEESAFAYYDNMVSIEIPDSVNKIGHSAFSDCNNLKLEKLTTTDRTIENYAFNGVTIEEVEVSGSFVPSGECVFEGAEINQISFEKGIRVIPTMAFSNCDSIEAVKIPKGVTVIGESAFYHCDNLKAVEIPNSVNKVGHSAFNECSNLKLEKLTTNGRIIQHYAFSGVIIEELEVSESLVTDGNSSFSGAKINRVSFEEGINVIPTMVFSNCDSIEEIRIPDSVTGIRDSAFARCNNLKIVVISNSVTDIGKDVFIGCKNLTLSVSAGSYAETYAIEEGISYQSY